MKRVLLRVGVGVAAAGVIAAGLGLTSVARDIRRQSRVDEAQAADVIVVLGAAEYRGHPSPVLEARLNHALFLYLRNLAPNSDHWRRRRRSYLHRRRRSASLLEPPRSSIRGNPGRIGRREHRAQHRRGSRDHAPHEPAILHRRQRRLSHLSRQEASRESGNEGIWLASSGRSRSPGIAKLAIRVAVCAASCRVWAVAHGHPDLRKKYRLLKLINGGAGHEA